MILKLDESRCFQIAYSAAKVFFDFVDTRNPKNAKIDILIFGPGPGGPGAMEPGPAGAWAWAWLFKGFT